MAFHLKPTVSVMNQRDFGPVPYGKTLGRHRSFIRDRWSESGNVARRVFADRTQEGLRLISA
jgi:hypothetical protein